MPLEFQINLGGNFVEALEKNKKELGEHEKGTHKAAHALEVFEGELGKVRAGALGINFSALQEGGHFFTFDLAEGAALAFEAIHKVAEVVIDLGKEMIKAAGAAEDLNLAIKLDVGEEGAEKVNQLAESFAGSRFSPKLIKEALLPILEESGDEHADQWNDLVTAATDVSVRRNTGSAGAKAALDALRSIEIQPQKIRGSLKELGIKQKDFYDDLGDLLGISEQAAEKQVKAGKVKAQTLLSVALHQIAEREGGSLGNATKEGSKTLGAALERLANLKDNLFERLAGSRGMQAVQGFLDNFVTTMEGPIGTDLVAKVGGAFEALFGDLSGPDGLKKMEDVVGGIATKVGEFVDEFKEAWPEIQADFEAAIPAIEKVAGVMGDIAKFMGAIPRLGGEIGDKNAQADIDLATGTVSRTAFGKGSFSLDETDREQALTRAGKSGFFHELFSSSSTLTKEALDQIDKEKGDWEPYVPKMAEGGIVSSPTLALIGEAGPEAVVPLGQLGGRGGMSFTFGDIIVQGGGGDAESIGQAVRVELKKLIDEAAAAYGAAA